MEHTKYKMIFVQMISKMMKKIVQGMKMTGLENFKYVGFFVIYFSKNEFFLLYATKPNIGIIKSCPYVFHFLNLFAF